MAERKIEELSEHLESVRLTNERDDEVDREDLERQEGILCCICQEACVNPVQLPCNHIFCFLCIKGVAARSSHCALCRHRILPGYLTNPFVVNKGEIKSKLQKSGNCHKWCYEARNGGWWLYEQRTSIEIDNAYKEEKQSVRLQISGFYYIIDLKEMIQYREDFPNRRRRIMRERVSTETVKGVAGIVIEGTDHTQDVTGDSSDVGANDDESNSAESNNEESDPETQS